MKNHLNRRGSKLIDRRLQLRLVGSFAGICILALLSQAIVFANIMTRAATSIPSGGEYVLGELPLALTTAFAVSLLLVLPGLLIVGVHVSHKFIGPMRGFERQLKSVVAGDDPGQIRIRPGDELQDFCGLLNAALDAARAQGRADQAGSVDAREQPQAQQNEVPLDSAS